MRLFQITLPALAFVAWQLLPFNTSSNITDIGLRGSANNSTNALASNVLFRSNNNGNTWQDISNGLPEDMRIDGIFAPSDDEIYLSSNLGLHHSPSISVSNTWKKAFWGGDGFLLVVKSGHGLFALKRTGGIYRSDQGKLDWVSLTEDLEDNIIFSVAENSDKSVVVSCNSGIFKLDNGTKTWRKVFENASFSYIETAANGTLYATCFQGVLRSTDGGEHWGWVFEDFGTFKLFTRLDGRLAVLTTGIERKLHFLDADGSAAQKAETNFSDWPNLLGGLWEFEHIVSIEQMGNYIFCNHNGGISRSVDGGKTWELVLPITDRDEGYRMEIGQETIFVLRTFGGC